MPDSQNINTSGQATIGHKFSILGHKSSIWFEQHLPPPAAYSPLSLPLTSVMEWIPNPGKEQAQEITQGKKNQGDAYSARSGLQCESLHACSSACRGRKGQEGAFLVSLRASLWLTALASESGSTSLISEAPSAHGISSLLLIYGLFFLSQETSQILQTTALTQPEEWCRGRNSLRQCCLRKKGWNCALK